jgi:hypothetical protein
MKPTIIKWILIIPAILFADWIIMITAGCLTSICGAGEKFYCGIYCYFAIGLLIISTIVMLWLGIKKSAQKFEI